jgi:hypothetical protein
VSRNSTENTLTAEDATEKRAGNSGTRPSDAESLAPFRTISDLNDFRGYYPNTTYNATAAYTSDSTSDDQPRDILLQIMRHMWITHMNLVQTLATPQSSEPIAKMIILVYKRF